ncbi:polysaccharide biosynthesis/export family protein [Puia dinghuensis]|nr:polysaccharide biosynthesis/export family protein [Puia dinghuensis]
MRKTTYFNDLRDGEITSVPPAIPLIHKNDILSISVSSLNPEASSVFNAPNLLPTASSTVLGATSQLVGYLVNEKGDILFPVIGTVHAEGLSTRQLSDNIAKILSDKKLLVDPIVSIRITNFKVTVLGEVGHPGVISVPSEQINILEALGFAGDLTIYGRRDNVLLIREKGGKKIVQHIDLNATDILSSQFYNLEPNDVIYVQPNKDKARSVNNTRQLLPVAFAALSFLVVVASLAVNKQL